MKFTPSHEWIYLHDTIAKVGITQYAQEKLGDIVYVELPKIGKAIKQGEEVAVLESTKAATDIYTPVSGIIVAINERLIENPELINQAPEKEGWIFQIELSNPKELDPLLDKAGYDKWTVV